MNEAKLQLWFVVGLISITLLALYAPRFAGAVVILVTIVLALEVKQKGLL